jgi:uncharacterized membrane protein
MRNGFFLGIGYNGAFFLLILLVAAIFVFFMLISASNRKKKYSRQDLELIEAQRKKYARGEITAEDYRKFIENIKHQNGI